MIVTQAPGPYRVRISRDPQDRRAAQRLRHLVFIEGAARPHRPDGLDLDRFDDQALHLMLEETATGALRATCRLQVRPDGSGIVQGYAAQFYDLTRLSAFPGPVLEIGRFCLHPEAREADLLRLAWGALTAVVDRERVGLLYGCSSFAGTDPTRYRAAFAHLAQNHAAPERWRPAPKADEIVPLLAVDHDRRKALQEIPALLRTYLTMGGWVSDHAVVDRNLGTLHVLTGVETARVPAARARALRALASAPGLAPFDAAI